MKKLKIKNCSATKSPIHLQRFGRVGFGKEIEVDEETAHRLCTINPKGWKPVKWTLPKPDLVLLKNEAGMAVFYGDAHVPQDGTLELEREDAIAVLTRDPENWSPVKWDPKKPASADKPKTTEPKK